MSTLDSVLIVTDDYVTLAVVSIVKVGNFNKEARLKSAKIPKLLPSLAYTRKPVVVNWICVFSNH